MGQGDRIVSEALVAYEQDLRHIQDGRYKAPYDMNITHRQFNPLFVLVGAADEAAALNCQVTYHLSSEFSVGVFWWVCSGPVDPVPS